MKQLLLVLLVVLLFMACKKSSFLTYNAKGDIYFYNHDEADYTYWETYFDSLHYSFSDHPDLNEDTLAVGIKISGDTAGVNRPFILVVDTTASDAVLGTDFTLPEMKDLFIPRGSVETKFYVKVFRTNRLLKGPTHVFLKLAPNQYFDTLIRDTKESFYNGVMVKATTLKVIIDDELVEPDFWKEFANYLGGYSQDKYLLILQVNKLDVKDDLNGLPASYFESISKNTQAYLKEQAANGNVIRERDGTVMTMGPDAQ